MDTRPVMVWGAGRIGRGFSAEVFANQGRRLALVDIDAELIDILKGQGEYTIFKTGQGGIGPVVISGYQAFHTGQTGEIEAWLLEGSPLILVAVHAPKLPEVAGQLAQYIISRSRKAAGVPMDILLNVNMVSPGAYMKELIEGELAGDAAALAYFDKCCGVVETVVMRISPATPEALLQKDRAAVLHNDFPEMVAGLVCFAGKVPSAPMLRISADIHAEEVRKIYTLNMAHAYLSYTALPLGYKLVHQAMESAEVRRGVETALSESGAGLCGEFGFSQKDMIVWNQGIVDMLVNPYLGDDLFRLGADLKRKLSQSDRLTGPALLALKHGARPKELARAIRAGFDYPGMDLGTKQVKEILSGQGLARAVELVCGIDAQNALFSMIVDA